MTDVDDLQIRDIFGISSEQNKDSNEFETNVDSIAGEVTFADRVQDLNEKIKKDDQPILALETNEKMDNQQLIEESLKPDETPTESAEPTESKEAEEAEGYDGIFDQLEVDETSSEKSKEPKPEEPPAKQEQNEEKPLVEEPKVIEETNNDSEKENATVVVDHVKIVKGKIKWLLTHSDKRYDAFYSEKRTMLNDILGDNQIPYNKWMNELKNSTADMSTAQVYDLQAIQFKMIEIQKLRDRVQEISLQSNAQYFIWERSVEMFHGLLARTQYEKPVIRQEGLIYEHMRDMELYFAQLKAVHRSADQVAKTLESAWETFSRQVTIAMQNRESVERYQKTTKQQKSEDSGSGSEFDALPAGAESKPVSKKTRVVSDWNDIT